MSTSRHLCSFAFSFGLASFAVLIPTATAQAQPAPSAQPQPLPVSPQAPPDSAQPQPPPGSAQPQPPPVGAQPQPQPPPLSAQPQPQQVPPAAQPPGYGPPYYPPSPPGYYPLPFASPRTLPYRAADRPPDGYRLETRLNRGLVIAGSSVLGGAYLVSLFTAGTILSEGDRYSSSYSPLFVPVIGPFVTLGTGRDVDLGNDNNRAAGLLLLFDGITQVTGLALLIVGFLTDQNIWIRSDIPQRTSKTRRVPDLFVGPRSAALRFRF